MKLIPRRSKRTKIDNGFSRPVGEISSDKG
jgi:hypothetical protein